MCNLHKIIIIVFLSLLFLCPQEVYAKAGKTSAAFLKIGVGAKALAMGGAFCAIADDATAMYWNPAGLGSSPKALMLTYNELDYGIDQQFLSFIWPFEKWALGLAVTSLDAQEIEIRSGPTLETEGEGLASNFAAIVAVSTKIGNLSIGGCIKYILDDFSDVPKKNTYTFDIGLLWSASDRVNLGVVARNTTGKIGGKPLPKNLRVAMAWKPIDSLTLSMGIEAPYKHKLKIHAGMELWLWKKLAIRFGGEWNENRQKSIKAWNLSGGLGFIWQDYTIDYAYLPYGDLIKTNQISLRIKY